MVSGDGEMSAPRGEAAAGSAANEGSSAMVATSGGGEADELIDEVARNEVNERRPRGGKPRNQRRRERRERE